MHKTFVLTSKYPLSNHFNLFSLLHLFSWHFSLFFPFIRKLGDSKESLCLFSSSFSLSFLLFARDIIYNIMYTLGRPYWTIGAMVFILDGNSEHFAHA